MYRELALDSPQSLSVMSQASEKEARTCKTVLLKNVFAWKFLVFSPTMEKCAPISELYHIPGVRTHVQKVKPNVYAIFLFY